MNDFPRIDGRGFTATPETLIEAIDRAILSYRNRTGQEPTHVALPSWADPVTLNLALALAKSTGAGGPVVVGRAQNGSGPAVEPNPIEDEPRHPMAGEPGPEPEDEGPFVIVGGRLFCRRPDCRAEQIAVAPKCWACGYDGGHDGNLG